MTSRTKIFIEKSVAAMLSAIEIYNKPDFKYREETFSILALNGWELLIKAKLLQNSGKLQTLYILNKSGKYSKNRSGTKMTKDLFKTISTLEVDYKVTINSVIKSNLEALTEIRDTSVHFFHYTSDLQQKIFEIGTACVSNYMKIAIEWFNLDLSKYNLYLMPLAFNLNMKDIKKVNLNNPANSTNLFIKYIETQSLQTVKSDEFNYLISVNLNFIKDSTESNSAIKVTRSNSPNAIPITISDENLKAIYPLTYKDLLARLKERYKDFTHNNRFQNLKKQIIDNPEYAHKKHRTFEKTDVPKIYYTYKTLNYFDTYYQKVKKTKA